MSDQNQQNPQPQPAQQTQQEESHLFHLNPEDLGVVHARPTGV